MLDNPIVKLLSKGQLPPHQSLLLLALTLEAGIILAIGNNFLNAMSLCGQTLPVLIPENAINPITPTTPECQSALFDHQWLYHLKQAIIHENPLVAGGTILTMIYPNLEAGTMFLAKLMNEYNEQKALARGRAEAEAAAAAQRAADQAENRAWFELYQSDPTNAPPPPFASNGHSSNGSQPE